MKRKIDGRSDKIWRSISAVVVAVLLLGGTRALARDWYLMDFNGTYGTWGEALDSCNLCHTDAPWDYRPINGFGSDYADPGIGGFTFNPALENRDSDGDGFLNLREIQAMTFPGDPASRPPAGPSLVSLSVLGSASVNEGQTAAYGASASWDDGSTTTVTAAWDVAPGTYASIDASGILTAFDVASDQDVTVSATYDGTTATRTVRIVNVPTPPTTLPADAIILKPVDGATGIPVTAVVMATLNGSGDISAIVNANTFSLSAGGSAPSSLSDGAAPVCADGGNVIGTIDYNDSRTEATFTPTCRLSNATAYTAVVVPATGTQPVLPAPVSSTFTTIAGAPDSDGDGVPDNEDNHPNDPGKASPPCVRGWGKILVERFGSAGIAIAGAEGISDMHPQLKRQGKPFGDSFLNGMVRYKLTNVPPGGTVTVAITFPAGIPRGSRIFKGGPNGFREDRNAVVNGNKVTVTLRDGGEGDEDGVVNGEIDDPIGVAVPDSAGSGTPYGTLSASGGCSVGGSGGGWSGAFGAFAIIGFVWMLFALLRRLPGDKS